MSMFSKENQKPKIEIDTSKLRPSQIRLLKNLNEMLTHVITTKDEADFFDGSAEFMKIFAELVKGARFSSEREQFENIPYSQQVLEYAMDQLTESMENHRRRGGKRFDN